MLHPVNADLEQLGPLMATGERRSARTLTAGAGGLRSEVMGASYGAFGPHENRYPTPQGMEAYARIEGMVGEEQELLEIPAHERSERHHARLREIGEELDRIWKRLENRAHR